MKNSRTINFRDLSESWLPIRCFPSKIFLINLTTKQLHISTTTIKLLLMLYRKLENQCFVLVIKLWKFCRDGKKPIIWISLDTCAHENNTLYLKVHKLLFNLTNSINLEIGWAWAKEIQSSQQAQPESTLNQVHGPTFNTDFSQSNTWTYAETIGQ